GSADGLPEVHVPTQVGVRVEELERQLVEERVGGSEQLVVRHDGRVVDVGRGDLDLVTYASEVDHRLRLGELKVLLGSGFEVCDDALYRDGEVEHRHPPPSGRAEVRSVDTEGDVADEAVVVQVLGRQSGPVRVGRGTVPLDRRRELDGHAKSLLELEGEGGADLSCTVQDHA